MDYLNMTLVNRKTITAASYADQADFTDDHKCLELAIAWPVDEDCFMIFYYNTVPTPECSTHESGLRTGLTRSLKAYGELLGNRKIGLVTSDDICGNAAMLLSVFIRDPQFQGQTKEKLASPEATRMVDNMIKDH